MRWCGTLLLASLAGLCAAQSTRVEDPERQQAMQLFDERKYVEALPLLERVAVTRPRDSVVMERLGFAILANAAGITDPESSQRERRRARQVLLQAQALGDNSNLLQVLLQGIPEDGGAAAFSANKAVEGVMHEAEAAFGRGDLKQALDGYLRAFALDPHLYEAAVFAGDSYFKMQQNMSACEWYARAVQVNPDRETAYRYWGDALMAMGQNGQARTKFIEAIVAEPYQRTSWVGVEQWAGKNSLSMSFPRIVPPHTVSPPQTGAGGPAAPKDKAGERDGTSAWVVYPLIRADWAADRFAKVFPEEKKYRHTLREEAESLHKVVERLQELVEKRKVRALDPSLALLLRLDDQGLLEAYVLFAAADRGIQQDYAGYRAANRDRLRRYLSEYVVPGLQ
jgi:tetratricopeptide (TPR) repeat protein